MLHYIALTVVWIVIHIVKTDTLLNILKQLQLLWHLNTVVIMPHDIFVSWSVFASAVNLVYRYSYFSINMLFWVKVIELHTLCIVTYFWGHVFKNFFEAYVPSMFTYWLQFSGYLLHWQLLFNGTSEEELFWGYSSPVPVCRSLVWRPSISCSSRVSLLQRVLPS